jgi:hypothetical protein
MHKTPSKTRNNVFLRSFAERFDDGFLTVSTITLFLCFHSFTEDMDNTNLFSEMAAQETPQNKTTITYISTGNKKFAI